MLSRRTFSILSGAGLCGMLLCGGCSFGPAVYPVTGRVIYENGQPVDHGKVEFRSRDGQFIGQATLDRNGTFNLRGPRGAEGLPAGDYQAIVVQVVMTDVLPTALQQHESAQVSLLYADYNSTPLQSTIETDQPNEVTLRIERQKDEDT